MTPRNHRPKDQAAASTAQSIPDASESRYRSILNASPDGIAITDLSGRVTQVSPMAERMLRSAAASDLVGRAITDFIVPEDRARATERIGLLLAGRKTAPAEYRGLRLDGGTFDIEVNAEFIRDAAGEMSEIVFLVRDITERRQAQDQLTRSHHLLRSIVETIPARTFWKGRDLAYLGCNSRFAADAGLSSPDEVIGKTDFDLPWRDQAALYRADDEAVMRSGVPKIDYEEPQTTPEERVIWLSTSKVPLRDAEHGVMGILGIYNDVTARKEADDSLREALSEKESLLKEIHHRVKNNLQVINSLLRLEAGRSAEPAVREALGEMQGRVRSMAVLHETLYRTRTFGRVDLAAYLKDLAQQFIRANGAAAPSVRLVLELMPVEVRIDHGIPCGLILNELMTNSIKYAFTDGRPGEIRIALRGDGPNEVLLQVGDTGPGLPDDFATRRDRSLGLQLVSDLTRQIGGRLTLSPGPGARFDVRFAVGTGAFKRPRKVGARPVRHR